MDNLIDIPLAYIYPPYDILEGDEILLPACTLVNFPEKQHLVQPLYMTPQEQRNSFFLILLG
jgi:hypothetical protein